MSNALPLHLISTSSPVSGSALWSQPLDNLTLLVDSNGVRYILPYWTKQEKEMTEEFEVAVVGGGPVGLWLSCELALAKVRVIVLERRSERVSQSRALTIHGRTLEVLALRGIADRFLSRGRIIPTGHFGMLDTRLDFSVFDTRFPFTLFLPQATTEALLEERARELGVEVRRACAVSQLEQHADGVSIVGLQGETPFSVRSRFVVGADGARSVVRRDAGIDFPGYPARHTMMLGDVVLDAPPTVPVISLCNEAGGAMVVPLGDGVHHRVVVIDPKRIHVQQSEPVTLAELSDGLALIVGEDFRPRDPIWFSRFSDETRLAAHYRKGGILLAGDAAHMHAPTGGQGMNVGLQDAMNLGWKLARVIHGEAPEALLDTYERERRPVGEALYRNTLSQASLITSFDPEILALRQTLSELLRLPEANRKLADDVSGFSVVYSDPVWAAPAGWEHRIGESGKRLSDKDLTLADGSQTTLYGLLEKGDLLELRHGRLADATGPTRGATVIDLKVGSDLGQLAPFAAALVRPDGYLAHVLPAA